MSDWNSDAGEVHKRLMKNHCPKCDQYLQVIEMNKERITRKCNMCNLVIQDNAEDAEIPPGLCE